MKCSANVEITLRPPVWIYQGKITVNLDKGLPLTSSGSYIVTDVPVPIDGMNIHIVPCFLDDTDYFDNDVGEILDVVLVVHLCELFEDDELVDG